MVKLLILILTGILSIINEVCNEKNIISLVISILITLYLSASILYHEKFNKQKLFFKIVVSLIVGILIANKCFTSYHYTELSLKNTSDYPIIIDAIYLDGSKSKINSSYNRKLSVKKGNLKTEYNVQNKNTPSYKATLMPNQKYKIDISKIKSVEVEFERGKKTNYVLINNKKLKIKSFDYNQITDKAKEMKNYNYKYSLKNDYINFNGFRSILVLLLVILVNFIFVAFSLSTKSFIKYILLLILEFNPITNLNILLKLILFICVSLLSRIKDIDNFDRKYKIMFGISSIYISFSLFGKYLIDNFHFVNLLYYLVLSLFIYKLFPIFIKVISMLKNKINYEKNTSRIVSHRIILFCVISIILILYQFAFYPYIYLTDGYMQVLEITSNSISDWQPYIHTYMLKLFVNIFNSYVPFIYFRIFVYSSIITFIMSYFYRKGMSLIKFYLIPIIFTILPTTGVVMITLLKDIDFAMCLTLLSFYLYVIYNDFSYFNKNKLNCFFLLISLIGVGFFRTNGFYVSIIIALVLLCFSIKGTKKMLYTTIIIFLIISFCIKIPLFKTLKIKKAPENFEIATMLHGFDYLIAYHPEKIDADTLKYLTSIISKKDYILYYDKYNIDILLHYNSDDEDKKIRNLKINKNKLINCYIKQFFKSPIYLLKDRLYGTDIIWNVIEDDKINELNYQTLYDEFGTNYKNANIRVKRNNKTITNILQSISSNWLLNIIFFRMGIYIDILIVLINYQVINRKKKTLICLFPLIITLLTLFIAMHYQTVRYLYMMPGIIIIFSLVVFHPDNKREIDNDI